MQKKRSKLNIRFKRFKKKVILRVKKHKILCTIVLALLIFLFWVIFMYKKYVNNDTNKITEVYFDKHIIENLQLIQLVEYTEDVFSGTNSVKDKILKFEKQKEKIEKKYNFIENLWVDVINNNTLQIWFNFKKPQLELLWSGVIYAVYNQNNIKKFNIDNISWLNLNLTWTLKLYLPKYLDWEDMQLIFYQNDLKKIQKYMKKILNTFPNSNLYYLAWWENIKVQLENQVIFLSLNKDIDKQINQYLKIKEKLNNNVQETKIIDLWNLDEWVYLKKVEIWK